jgi:hypothetical protein
MKNYLYLITVIFEKAEFFFHILVQNCKKSDKFQIVRKHTKLCVCTEAFSMCVLRTIVRIISCLFKTQLITVLSTSSLSPMCTQLRASAWPFNFKPSLSAGELPLFNAIF